MKYYGYIEGYYGRMMSHGDRKRIIQKLSEQGMNSYLVASKEDPWHRIHWAETPPQAYFEELGDLIAFGKERGVIVVPAVAPGLSGDWFLPHRESILLQRFQSFADSGATHVALLMDDIPVILPESLKGTYESLGDAHGALLNRISAALPSLTTLFCPTIYTDELLGSSAEADRYLPDLQKTIPDAVSLFWTGENTISQEISGQSCERVVELFGERVIFWDNIYANDYATTRLFVGSYERRDGRFISERCGGIMINPTGLIETDLFLIELMGDWFSLGEVLPDLWNEVANRYGVPAEFHRYLPWFRSPFDTPSLETLMPQERDPLRFFNEIVVRWQSPLKQEWYPYLHRFFTELKLFTGKIGPGPWFDQRFYPYTAERLKSGTTVTGYFLL